MNKQKVEELFPIVMETLKRVEIVNEQNQVPKEYNGYIASFGASIIQSGILPAIAFFERNTQNTEQDKKRLMTAILYVLDSQLENQENKKLLDYVLSRYNNLDEIEEKILYISVAMKLVLRTYEQVEENKEN